MLPANFIAPKEEKQSYDALPEDIYQVELLDIIEEMKPKYKQEGEEKKLKCTFAVLSHDELRKRLLFRNYVPATLYIGKDGKNVLYQIAEALLRREVTTEEEATGLSGELLNSFVGKQCKVFVKQTKKGENTYSNIDRFLKAESALQPLTTEEKEDLLKSLNKDKKKDEVVDTATEMAAGAEEPQEVTVDDIPFK